MEQPSEDLVPDIGYFIYRRCTPRWSIDESVIDFYDVTYVVDGQANYEVNGRRYKPGKGTLMCLPPGSLRRASAEPEDLMECYSFNFKLHTLDGKPVTLPFPMFSSLGHRQNLVDMYRHLNHVWTRKDPGFMIQARGLALLIFHRLFELMVYNTDTATYDLRVKRTMRYITDHFSEKITVQILAEREELNTVYFGMLFKREAGITVNQYLNRVRVAQAENLLSTGEYTVSDVAERCGFCDEFYFNRMFKALKGVPPSKFLPNKGA